MQHSIRIAQLALARWASGVIVLVGVIVIIGWLFDIDVMKTMVPGYAAMKANTALCAILLGGALYSAARREQRTDHRNRIASTQLSLSALALFVALLTLAQYLWSVDFGIDGLIGVSKLVDSDPHYHIRMSPVTAVAIALGAGALLLLALPSSRRGALPQVLATLLCVLMLTVIYGYLYDVQDLYQTFNFAPTAAHTALAFLLLGLGILALTADRGWVADFSHTTPSSAAARNTLLPVLLMIPFIGSLRLAGQRAGWYGTGFGLAIMSVVFMVAVAALLAVNSRRASIADRELARLSRLYSQLSQTNQAIVRCADELTLYPRVCEVAIEFGQFDFAWIGLLDAAAGVTRVVAEAGVAPGVLSEHGDADAPPRRHWPYAPTLLLNKFLFSSAPRADPAPTPWHESALRAGYYSAAIPIRRNEVVVGSFNLYAREAEFFAAYAISTLEEVALDISFALDNHAREAARTAALSALQASEQRYEELAQRLPVGLFSLRIDGEGRYRYSYVSPRYCQLLGVSVERMLADGDTPLHIAHPDDYAEFLRFRARGRDVHGPASFDLRFMVGAEVRWIRTLGQRNPDQDGDVIWSGIVVDITEQVRAEHERDRLRGQLMQAQKMEALGQLTGGIAHDFNNILGSVLGFTTLALSKEVPDPDSKLAQYLREVRQGAERARDLVAKMLKFSRLEPVEPRADVLQPRAAIEEVMKLLSAVLPASMEVVRDYDEQLPALAIGAVAFHQLVMNLAINARDAMAGQGRLSISVRRTQVTPHICASCQREFEGDYVALRIADNGVGIAAENYTEIFRPFFTTKEVGKGTGLGLAMVHGIVHDAHGHILLESVPAQGTTFHLLFPVVGDTPPTLAAASHTLALSSGDGARIAIVDDEPALTRLWQELLEGSGYRVTSFNDSATALAAFNDAPDAFDAMVLDMTMPRLSGDGLAHQILTRRPDLPVFICTGYSDRLDALLAQSLGIRGVFTKPVDFDEVLKTLAQTLAETRAAALV